MISSALARPGRAWLALAGLLAVLALAGWFLARNTIDWQPALFTQAPWRSLTAVGVHYSGMHLAANLAGAAAVGALGYAAAVPRAAAWAWFAAWPLTQIGLLVEPRLMHYGGLSGVLHGGVAVVALWLLCRAADRRQRLVAAALMIGLVAKVASESPWGEPLRHSAVWAIATAPLAHATGLLAGLLSAAVALRATRAASSDQTHSDHD